MKDMSDKTRRRLAWAALLLVLGLILGCAFPETAKKIIEYLRIV